MFFDTDYVRFIKDQETVTLADQTYCLPVTVLDSEHKRVRRVSKDLQTDIEKVTGQKPERLTDLPDYASIIVGTVENKELMNYLEINVDELKGKWESFIIETVTLPNHTSPSIVILGSDDRGAIFGVYDLTEKIGVSPWYWWMDVPVKQHEALYIKKGRVLKGEPSVQYRGFFLNDEGPSLMTWVRTHFPDFTHEFYEKIFELTLRLKANYHWPAMWDSTFYEDDKQNILTADAYGVVIGTSHHEPMDRPHGDWKTHKQGPWDYAENETYLKYFWSEGIERSKPYETIINLGMRGDGDEPMGGNLSFSEKIKLMEKIIADQREIIQQSRSDKPVVEVPQMWALYKEVKEYYDSGMVVPDDVTLLWGDDNFGNIRRLPTKEERNRTGGAGIYYHFDYVGGPRSYKWVNTVPIQKTYEQMQKAYAYDARKVWIVNVGDLKPMEFQTEFFLRLAWDVEAFNPDNLAQYSKEWAEYTFGESYGSEIASIINSYVKFNGRLKPEVINTGNIYSWDNEFEAERLLNEFKQTVEQAERVLEQLPHHLKDAFYQVGYYPAKASYTVLRLQLIADLSLKHQEKGRIAANWAATEAKRLFELDQQLTTEYNKVISSGKWDHMMDQLHIGYTYWQQPEELIIPEVGRVNASELKGSEYDFDVEWVNSDTTEVYTKKPLYVDIYNKGNRMLDLTIVCSKDWVKVDKSALTLDVQGRIKVSIDWDNAPGGKEKAVLRFDETASGKSQEIEFTVDNPAEKLTGGFVPLDGIIAIEAEDYTDSRNWQDHKWTVIPDYGRTHSSMALYPVEFTEQPNNEEAPRLSYDFVLPEQTDLKVTIVTAPSLPFDPNRGMHLGISIDENIVEKVSPGDLSQNGKHDSPDWERSVIRNCHQFVYKLSEVSMGKHTLHLTAINPQVVIQKIIIDCGGVKGTYLGPMPTPHTDRIEEYNLIEPKELTDFSYLPGPLSKEAVFCLASGFYTTSSSGKGSSSRVIIDGKVLEDSSLVFLEKGFHKIEEIETQSDLALTLEKEWPLTIRPSVRFEQGEWVISLLLHYHGNASMNYVLAAGQTDRICFKTKGWLKTNEQRVLKFVCSPHEGKEVEELTVNIESNAYQQTLSIPLQ